MRDAARSAGYVNLEGWRGGQGWYPGRVALSPDEVDRTLAVLEELAPTGHAAAYCMEHLGARAGLPSDKLADLRRLVRGLRADRYYSISEPGVCDTGPHGVTDLVIRRARVSDLPTRV